MANNFNITISAIDSTTATVRKVNAGIGKAFRPFSKLVDSTRMLGREMGIGKLGAKIMNVGRAAGQTAGHLAGIAAPLTAIVGGGSIAGIAALATEWGRLGAETARTATTLGISTGYLQSMRGAATAAGLSSDAMTTSLKSLGDTMQDALYGRNQMALSMLSQLGIRIRHTKDGAIDTTSAFTDMSRAISGIKSPQVQGLVARTFGLEEMLPLLRQGPGAIDAFQKKVRDLGGVMSNSAIAAAAKFGDKLNDLKIAVGGVRNSIGDRLMPILTPLIEKFVTWLTVGKGGERIGAIFERIAHVLETVDFDKVITGINGFIDGISSVVKWIGGWKVAAIGIGLVMAGPLILSVVQLTAGLGKLGLFFASFIPGASAGLSGLAIGIGGVTAALAAGVAVGMALNAIFEKLSGGGSFGAKLYEWTHAEPDMGNHTNQPAAALPATTVSEVTRQQMVASSAAVPQSVSVDVHFKNAPPGTGASARDGGGSHVPVRVAHSMVGA